MGDYEVLQDDPHRTVVRIGDTVRRPMQPWSETVHELLRHLEAVGFPYAPRVLGVDDDGREVLSYIEGESGPAGWAKVVDETGLVAMARLLHDYHEAVRSFRGGFFCHGDFGPWNLVWRGLQPIGILDWDYAEPAPALHDVAYALEFVTPFRNDDECRKWLRYPAPPDRHRRMELFATAYGLTSTDGLADEVYRQHRLVLTKARKLAAEGRQPQLTWQQQGALDDQAQKFWFF